MGSIVKDRLYKIGDTTPYQSIYGYRKNRVAIIDVETGQSVGDVKEERTPGIPGQPEITVYYTRGINKPHGTLRFYQSPEALVIALGGQIATERFAAVQPVADVEVEKKIIKVADADESADDSPKPTSDVEARIKALEDKVFLGPAKSRRTPAKKPARKPAAKKSAKKPGARARKVKEAL